MITRPPVARLSAEALRRQRARNRAIFWVLFGFAALVFLISIAKMKGWL
jgi:hypothetical protein